MRPMRGWCVATAIAVAASEAGAQFPIPDSIRVTAERRNLWRGLDRGEMSGGIDGAMTLLGLDESDSWQATIAAEFHFATMDKTALGPNSHVSERLALIRHSSGEGERFWGSVGATQFPDEKVTSSGFQEIGIGGAVRLPWWWPERNPLLAAEVLRNVTDGLSYARPALTLDYKWGATKAAFLTVGHAWSDYGSRGSIVSHATDLGVQLDFDSDPARSRSFSTRWELFLGATWSRLNRDPQVGNFGARYAIIF
jgi:hypothetical protein